MQQPQWDKEQGGRAAYLRSPQYIPDNFSYPSYQSLCVSYLLKLYLERIVTSQFVAHFSRTNALQASVCGYI